MDLSDPTVRSLAKMPGAGKKIENACFFMSRQRPGDGMAYADGIKWIKADEKRMLEVFNSATKDAAKQRGAYFHAQAARSLLGRASKTGEAGLLNEPIYLEDDLAGLMVKAGFNDGRDKPKEDEPQTETPKRRGRPPKKHDALDADDGTIEDAEAVRPTPAAQA